jgi:hypothetical protein
MVNQENLVQGERGLSRSQMVSYLNPYSDLALIAWILIATFTAAYLMKHNLLLRGKNNLVCSICDEFLNTYTSVRVYFVLLGYSCFNVHL